MHRYFATPFSILNAVFDFFVSLLALRFVFMMLGANASNGLISMLYSLTDSLVLPFRSIFPDTIVGDVRLEWSVIIAMVAYSLLAMVIMRVLHAFFEDLEEEEREYARIHARQRHA